MNWLDCAVICIQTKLIFSTCDDYAVYNYYAHKKASLIKVIDIIRSNALLCYYVRHKLRLITDNH